MFTGSHLIISFVRVCVCYSVSACEPVDQGFPTLFKESYLHVGFCSNHTYLPRFSFS